jgi:PadR family transcriptional regulator, regulatory protein PadR
MPTLPQGTLDLLILQTLAKGARHGYGIARWIEDTTDDVLGVEEGALYPALYRLQQRGWIKAEWARSELNKDIKVYELTTAGRAELIARTASWTALAKAITKVIKAK